MIRRALVSSMFFLFVTQTTSASSAPPQSGTNLGNVRGGDFRQAQRIISRSCTKCHSREKIDAALTSGKDMVTIQKNMEKRGAVLNANEREVLGIYWKQITPLKKTIQKP